VYPMRILAHCLLPNHWHFILWPENDGDLSAFLQRLTNTHTQRWQRAKDKVGYGHLYQGRFKSFPVETDEHFYSVVRYVERNALRAKLVARAESWRWGSLWRRVHRARQPLLTRWPVPEPRKWVEHVNQRQAEGEVAAHPGLRSARNPLRQRRVGPARRESARLGVNSPPPRPPQALMALGLA